MSLEQAKKKRYFFDVVEGVQVPSVVSIRATNLGVDVTIDCPVFEYQESATEKPKKGESATEKPKKGESKPAPIIPVIDKKTPFEKFVEGLEVERKLISDDAENSITYSMQELFDKVSAE